MIVLLAVFLLSVSGLVAGWFVVHSRSRLLEDAARNVADISRVVAGQLGERIRLLDDIIQQSGDSYRNRLEQNTLNSAEMDGLLATQVETIGKVIRVLGIVGQDGVTRYSSRGAGLDSTYTGDRAYFRQHRDEAQRALLSGPVLSRSDGQPTFYITRRVDDRHGRFLGVVFASIDPTVFERDLARMGLPEGSETALLTPGGGVVARFPPATNPAALTSGDTPSFVIQGDTPPTAATRVAADAAVVNGSRLTYRVQLAGLPMALDVSVPKSAALGLWYEDIRSIAAVTAVIAVGLLVVLAGLHRQLRLNDGRAAALAHTQELLEAAQSLAQLGSWLWEPGRRTVEISQQFATLLGIESSGGVRPGRLWQAIHPADRSVVRDAWRKLVRDGTTQHFEVRIVRPGGEACHMAADVRRNAARTGQPSGFFGTVLDMTQRKRIEEERRRWADAFENAAYAIAITDARSNTQITANPAYAAMHGMTTDELTGMEVGRLYPPDETEVRLAAIQTSDTIGHTEFDTVRVRKDGTRFPARIWLTTVSDGGGKPLYRIASIIDMTERKSIEQQLVQAQKMEAIGNLSGGIAHDFNNLLGVIVISLDSLQLLLKDNEEANALVSDCLAAALSGASLTQRLLAFAHQQTLAPSLVSINDLVAGMVALMRRSLGENIVVSLELDAGLWPAFVDPSQLEASILNLAMNARDAMPDGGRLLISTANKHIDPDCAQTHPELKPGDYATLLVSDNGVGMTAEVKDRIFEPFYTTKKRGQGTGLGLSMVFGFMRQSNGLITVYTELGKGTTFRLYFPRSTGQPVGEMQTAGVPPTVGGGGTILVVEDNELLRKSVVRNLAALNYHVLSASDAASALATLEERAVDVVLSDVVMPGTLDGIALAREVLARWPGIKIVLTSGFVETKVNGNVGGLAPSVRFLNKPYRRDELARVIRGVLDG
jgi:PAS domain S-box-containing protein